MQNQKLLSALTFNLRLGFSTKNQGRTEKVIVNAIDKKTAHKEKNRTPRK